MLSNPPPVRGRFAIQRNDFLWYCGGEPAQWVADSRAALIFKDLDEALTRCAALKQEGHRAVVISR